MGWGRGWSGLASLGLLVGLAVFASAPAAVASYDPLSSGATNLALERPFLALLRENGVRILATAPAKFKAGALTLPVSGGELDPTLGKGTIEQAGGVTFVAAKRRVVLSELMLKIKPAPLYAKVGGGQLKLAAGAGISTGRDGFGTRFTATDLRLTAKFAERLDKKLRLAGHPLKPGEPFGTLISRPLPATVAVLGRGRASLAPSPTLLAHLHELHVSLNPIAPAELAPGPLFSLPILAGGQIAPDGRSGTLRSGGAVEFLQLGAGQLFVNELWFGLGEASALAEADLEPSPSFPGKQPQAPLLTLDLSGAAITADPKRRTVSVSSASLALSATLAADFNQLFAKPQEKPDVFHAGELFGTVSFTAQTQ